MSQRVLFVCLGNICRSPLAEGVFKHLVDEAGLSDEFDIDSAGTSAYHVGDRADSRMLDTARKHGIELTSRARKVAAGDFGGFDLIVAMDEANERDLRSRCPDEHLGKIKRMRGWDPEGDGDVPDPYYGGARGFDTVYDIVLRSCRALLDELK